MSTNKNIRPAFLWRPALVIIAIAFGLLVIFFTWQYFINRPNYRDLRREYSKLVLPSDWQLVSESGNKGVWGLFCWQIEGSECPYVGSKYSSKSHLNPKEDKSILDKIADSAGFVITERIYKHCELTDDKYYCGVKAKNKNFSLEVSIGGTNGNKILRIHLNQYGG